MISLLSGQFLAQYSNNLNNEFVHRIEQRLCDGCVHFLDTPKAATNPTLKY